MIVLMSTADGARLNLDLTEEDVRAIAAHRGVSVKEVTDEQVLETLKQCLEVGLEGIPAEDDDGWGHLTVSGERWSKSSSRLPRSPLGSMASTGTPPRSVSSISVTARPVLPEPVMPTTSA